MTTQGMLVDVAMRPILQAILAERQRQIALGYTPEHDDKLSHAQWVAILSRHVGLLTDDGGMPAPLDRIARQLVRTAAIAIAGLEVLARVGVEIPVSLLEEKPAGPTPEQRGSGH